MILPATTIPNAQAIAVDYALSEPDEGGNLDTSSTTIDGDTFTLIPRGNNNEAAEGYRWLTMLFKLAGANGKTPTFVLPYEDCHALFAASTWRSNVEPVWSYTYPAGESGWQKFDTYDRSNNNQLTFYNGSSFTQSTVYVSLNERQAISEFNSKLTTDYFQRSYVSAPSGGGVDGNTFQVETQPGVVADPPIFTRDIPDLPIYACIVEESARNPDKVVLIVCGQHPFEHKNKQAFEGFVEFITSEDVKAQTYRDHFTTICFPHVNPSGEYSGIWRGPASDPSEDLNRSWGQADQVAFQGDVETAMQAEITALGMGDPVAMLDFHQAFGDADGYVIGRVGAAEDFVTALSSYVSGMQFSSSDRTTPGVLGTYAVDQWSPVLSLTMERPIYTPYSTERMAGEAYAKALADRAAAGDYNS